MTNHEFTMRATQIAKRASSWAHDTLTRGQEHASREMFRENAQRFSYEIREMLDSIYKPGEQPPVRDR